MVGIVGTSSSGYLDFDQFHLRDLLLDELFSVLVILLHLSDAFFCLFVVYLF